MSRRFELLRHLTSEWPGDVLGEGRLVRILNPGGSKAPLIWCYNASHEFPMMAAGLGMDQPLIGVRSLHMVEPNGTSRYMDDEATAATYAQALLACLDLDLDGCAIGGNCQGAGIAFHLAAHLLMKGKKIRTLITMEAQSPMPFPGRVGLIFGAKSALFNPFLRNERPEERWNRLFREHVVEIVPGSHGEYFSDENCPALCAAIARILDDRERAGYEGEAPEDFCFEVMDLPQSAGAGEPLAVRLRSSGADRAVVHYFWTSSTCGIMAPEQAPSLPRWTSGEVGVAEISIDVPAAEGEWRLHIFACEEKGGPLSWATDHARTHPIRIS